MAVRDDDRLAVLERLLKDDHAATQEELRRKLSKLKFKVNQSTISRDLRRLAAVKAVLPDGQVVYRLPVVSSTKDSLVRSIQHNGSLIVIQTTPGSASLVARILDESPSDLLLGTIAGDDTVFVAPADTRRIDEAVDELHQRYGLPLARNPLGNRSK